MSDSALTVLSDKEYVRQRLEPSRFGRDYIHLSDLALLIKRIAPKIAGSVFDYGCGGAPYASLFSGCSRYVGADSEPGPAVSRILRPDGLTDEPEGSYDFVLSTQVLEHVRDPQVYLRECLRILRPGGHLLLSTHGMVAEHGCPHDYQRWTAHGLELLASQAGFETLESGKLTTQIRGMVQTMNGFALHFRAPNRPILNFFVLVARKIYIKIFQPILHVFADWFPEQSITDASSEDCIYVAIYVYCRKKGSQDGR